MIAFVVPSGGPAAVKNLYRVFEQLTWVGQLGLSLLLPLVLLLAGCWWLTTHAGVGMWVYVPGFLLGLALGATTFAQFLRYWVKEQDRQRREDGPPRTGFNGH